MGAALNATDRKDWNLYVEQLKFGDLDLLASRLFHLEDKSLYELADRARNMALALPTFDADGNGSMWGGTHKIFKSEPDD
jgi:hypothetical protein